MPFTLTLSRQEAETLRKALSFYTGATRNEISRTDDLKFRSALQADLETLKSIEDRLEDDLLNPEAPEPEQKAG